MQLSTPLITNNGTTLRGIVLGRLSKPKETEDATQATIESSYIPVDVFLDREFRGPKEIRYLGEQINGFVTDRATLIETWSLIETGEWDVVICEDLGRVFRNPRHQIGFVQDCFDAQIRCICLADQIDTADDNWEWMLSVATVRHGMHVPDTRRRLKRKTTYSFEHGVVQKLKFGYRKLTKEEADSGEFGLKGFREAKVPEHTDVFQKIRHLALELGSAAAIVDWLKKERIAPGPFVKGDWTIAILKSAICDPKLQGWKLGRKTLYFRRYKNGERYRRKNQSPDRKFVAELAHMTADEQESMVAALGWEIDWNDLQPKRESPRLNVPHRRSYWPGRSTECGICEGPMLINGDHLRCRNSMKEFGATCWNHVEVPIELTRRKVIKWLAEQLAMRPAAKTTLIDTALLTFEDQLKRTGSNEKSIQKQIQSLQSQQSNLTEAIAQGGQLRGLLDKLAEIERKLEELETQAQNDHDDAVRLLRFTSRQSIEGDLEQTLSTLARTSFEFADIMRQFFPRFIIQPVQALDTPQVRPRGKLRLQFKDNENGTDGRSQLDVQFDLFDPPDHIALMSAVVNARSRCPQPTYREIGLELDTSHATVTRALKYAKLMRQASVDDPYVEVSEAPKNASRWRQR